ncbi:MAG: glycosyltransferase family 2 protein [Caulobacteraceae bacterium]
MSARIAVLLSTYNGENLLRAQLDSLLDQRGVGVELFVRDDGSSDATREILNGYAGHWPRLADVASGPNLGPAMSFLELLALVPDGFDGYAFCDQDDVWPPDKLERAARRLADLPAGQAGLYCARVMCVDADLRPLAPAPIKDDASFEHLLFENIAYGPTVVMNAAAARLVRSRPPTTGASMHDWWCALVTAAFGEVVYDPKPAVLYRQHGGNAIGQASGRLAELWRLARMFARAPRRFYPIHAQAAEFLRLWGDALDPDRRRLAEALVNSRKSLAARIAYAARGRMVRQALFGNLPARVLIALDLY